MIDKELNIMDFIKRQRSGFYFAAVTAVAAVVALIFYFVNCRTSYFINLGMNPAVIIGIICAVIALVAYVFLDQKTDLIVKDALPVISAVLLCVSLMLFIASRVNGIAAILTFTNNAQTMADLSSAIVCIILLFVAVVTNVIASYLRVCEK